MDKKIKIIGILLVVAIIIVVSYFSTNNPTGQIIFEPNTPSSCSESVIKDVWGTIFKSPIGGFQKVPLYYYETTPCDFYLASDLRSWYNFSILIGKETPNIEKEIIAINGNFDIEFIQTIRNTLSAEINSTKNILTMENLIGNSTESRNIATIEDAKTTFEDIFSITTGTWELNTTSNLYEYNELDNDKNLKAIVVPNKKVEIYYFYKSLISDTTPTGTTPTTTTGDCVPNWTEQFTSCGSTETKIGYYLDYNSCGNETDKPSNETINCDYDSNNLIGKITDVDTTRISIEMKIGNNSLNQSITYTGKKNITILDDNETLIEFEWDFNTKPFELLDLEIKKQSSSSPVGYLLINNLNATKTVKVDKKDSDSNSVCIKDSSTSINSLSDDCSDSDESLVPCPGSKDGYTCTISSGKFVVSGLNHSAVIEFLENASTTTVSNTTCNTNWTCGSWSTCANNTQTRTCIDNNSCNTTVTKPNESQSCGTTCTSNWNCTEWSPVECPESGSQTRSCTDSNSCGITSGKPPETLSCSDTEDDESGSILLFLIIIIILVAGGFLLFWYFKKRSENPEIPPTTPPTTPIPNKPLMRRPIQPPRKMIPRKPPINQNIKKPINPGPPSKPL